MNKIAIITPSYNGQDFLEKCIDNVKQQTWKNIHHYIFDDASTDNSKNILFKFENDPSVTVIYSEENKGQSFGRNTLIALALKDNCTHIAFHDVDDIWDIDHLETSLEVLGNNDIVYSHPRILLSNGTFGYFWGIVVPKIFVGKQLLHNNYIWISTVVAKAEIFSDTFFLSELNNIEDYHMWCQQYLKGRTFINKTQQSVIYYCNPNGHAGKSAGKYEIFNRLIPRIHHLKLNLGCGENYLDEYINVDLYPTNASKMDAKFDARKLPYENNSIVEIRAFDLIEHFDFFESQNVLSEWYRALVPGGKVYIKTPDLLSICDTFIKRPDMRIDLYQYLFSKPWIENHVHKFLYTEEQMYSQLTWAGFKNINRIRKVDNKDDDLYLYVEAFKL